MDVLPYCSERPLCYLDLFFVLFSFRLALYRQCRSIAFNALTIIVCALSATGLSSTCLLFTVYATYIHCILPDDAASLIESMGRVINIILNFYATVVLVLIGVEAFMPFVDSPTPRRPSNLYTV